MFMKTALLILLVVVLTSASFAQQSFPVTTCYLGNGTQHSITVSGVYGIHDIDAELYARSVCTYMVYGRISYGSSSSCLLSLSGASTTEYREYNNEDFNNVSISASSADVTIIDLYGTAHETSYYRVGEDEDSNHYD